MLVLPEWEIGQLAGLPKNKGVQFWNLELRIED